MAGTALPHPHPTEPDAVVSRWTAYVFQAPTIRILLAAFLCLGQPCLSQEDKTAAWLFRCQSQDGSWPTQAGEQPDLRATALAVLAILGNGRGTHLRSHSGHPHRESFQRAIDWLRAQQDEAGRIAYRADPAWIIDHALATFALCESARRSTEPSGSKHGVAALGALTRELQTAERVPAQALALGFMCIESTRRFDARMQELVEQYEGWRETLDAQPPWSKGANQLETELRRVQQLVAVRTPREHTAMLVVEAQLGTPSKTRLAAPLKAYGLDAIERDHVAMLLFALAAKAHLRASSEVFENAWWQFAGRVQARLLETRVAAGDEAGSWAPDTFAGTNRIRLTATLGLLLHQFKKCQERAPRAWTRTLQEALTGVDRLVVRADLANRSTPPEAAEELPPPLLDLADAKAVAEFVRRIEIDGARSGGWFCMCSGGPFLQFYRGDRLLTTVGMHHGLSLRWHEGPWQGDGALKLKSGQFVNSWLAERGVKGPKREVEQANERDRRDQLNVAKWRAAMPDSLQPLWQFMSHWRRSDRRLDEMRAALKLEQPDANQRIRMLLDWFGSGSRVWSGYPSYEDVALTLLLDFDTLQVIAAMDAAQLSARQLEGAARFFACWDFSSKRAAELGLLSEAWQRKLLAQGLKDADTDRRSRALNAFAK